MLVCTPPEEKDISKWDFWGGDKVIRGRFITGDSGEDKEANTAQVWCRRCAEVVLVFLPLVSLCPPLLALTSHHSAALLRLYLALIRHSTALTFSPFMVQTRRTKRASIPIVAQLKRSVLSTHLQAGFFLAAVENVREHLQRVYKYDYCDGGLTTASVERDRNDKPLDCTHKHANRQMHCRTERRRVSPRQQNNETNGDEREEGHQDKSDWGEGNHRRKLINDRLVHFWCCNKRLVIVSPISACCIFIAPFALGRPPQEALKSH